MFVDSYDWVMVPNVYGMSQYSDGGTMCTKPYISGSNYLLKMSTWNPKATVGDTIGTTGTNASSELLSMRWTTVWDGLFWRFLDKHRQVMKSCHRLGMLVGTLDKMDSAKRTSHFASAAAYLRLLDEQP